MPATTREHIIYARWLLKLVHADLVDALIDERGKRQIGANWTATTKRWTRIAQGKQLAPDGLLLDIGTVGYLILDYLRNRPATQPGLLTDDCISLMRYGLDTNEHPGRVLSTEEFLIARRNAQVEAFIKQAFSRK